MKASVMIGQSGGPTTVINASLQGIVETALHCESIDGVYGALNGIDGIIHHRVIDFRNKQDCLENGQWRGKARKIEFLPCPALNPKTALIGRN